MTTANTRGQNRYSASFWRCAAVFLVAEHPDTLDTISRLVRLYLKQDKYSSRAAAPLELSTLLRRKALIPATIRGRKHPGLDDRRPSKI
jgi:hypothetical protein